jgi:hypothetical protein
VVGDFDGDGRDDIALIRTQGGSLTVARSVGSGAFSVTHPNVGAFAGLARQKEARVVLGDFSGDGRTDIALTGGPAWTTIPVATATASGGFTISDHAHADFASWSAEYGTSVSSGDFDGDGRVDLAAKMIGWSEPRIAYSNGSGAFSARPLPSRDENLPGPRRL